MSLRTAGRAPYALNRPALRPNRRPRSPRPAAAKPLAWRNERRAAVLATAETFCECDTGVSFMSRGKGASPPAALFPSVREGWDSACHVAGGAAAPRGKRQAMVCFCPPKPVNDHPVALICCCSLKVASWSLRMLKADRHRPVQTRLDHHPPAPLPRMRRRQRRVEAVAESHRLVVGRHPPLPDRQDRRQVMSRPQRPVRVGRLPRRLDEAAVVPRRQPPRHGVGPRRGRRPRQARLLDPAVLGRAEGPLDAPLAPPAVRPDQLDAQLPQGPARTASRRRAGRGPCPAALSSIQVLMHQHTAAFPRPPEQVGQRREPLPRERQFLRPLFRIVG